MFYLYLSFNLSCYLHFLMYTRGCDGRSWNYWTFKFCTNIHPYTWVTERVNTGNGSDVGCLLSSPTLIEHLHSVSSNDRMKMPKESMQTVVQEDTERRLLLGGQVGGDSVFILSLTQLAIFPFHPLCESLCGMHIMPMKILIYSIIKDLKYRLKDLIVKQNFLYRVLF